MSVIQKLVDAYKFWHNFLPHFPKTSRHTLGAKIDSLFVETIEPAVIASHLPKDQKLPFIIKASNKLNLLKFFLQVAWQIKSLDNKKYISLSECFDEIGRMLGGWIKQTQTSAKKTTEAGKR